MVCYVYILFSASGDHFYVGISDHPERRLEFHNTVEKGYTSRYRPWKIVYVRQCNDRKDAGRIERIIKSWKSKAKIRRLVRGEICIVE